MHVRWALCNRGEEGGLKGDYKGYCSQSSKHFHSVLLVKFNCYGISKVIYLNLILAAKVRSNTFTEGDSECLWAQVSRVTSLVFPGSRVPPMMCF